jgi:6-phosphogluconate dehydrogenase
MRIKKQQKKELHVTERSFRIGIIGLGVMGRNLALNIAEHDYAVAGYDTNADQVDKLNHEGSGGRARGIEDLQVFMSKLEKPHNLLMLVPAGAPVDAVLSDLLPYLDKNDLVIDAGNSHFTDTDRRIKTVQEKGIHFLGMGISGGESGARHGPSLMPGGSELAYQRVSEIFKAASAKVEGEPCVAYLGPRSAGHYVKMVHNGIEYGLMQLLAETYDMLRRGLELTDAELHDVFKRWNAGVLNSYLVEITADIFAELDGKTGKPLIDVILDEAKQKGTGKWASQDAMELQIPTPTIDIGVVMRNLSAFKAERQIANQLYGDSVRKYKGDRKLLLEALHEAFYAAMIATYSQGFSLLRGASLEYKYDLNLETVARIWRGGCIIRSALLDDIRDAFIRDPELPNLILDQPLGGKVISRIDALREVASTAMSLGIPLPGMSATLSYLDAYRSVWLPANLIQAQRDYFGSHTYERIDERGAFHTQWNQ